MEEEILNVLGRIHRGEEVEDEVLRETVKKLYTGLVSPSIPLPNFRIIRSLA